MLGLELAHYPPEHSLASSFWGKLSDTKKARKKAFAVPVFLSGYFWRKLGERKKARTLRLTMVAIKNNERGEILLNLDRNLIDSLQLANFYIVKVV